MMMISKSEDDTKDEAVRFARTVEPGAVIFLRGNLGAGKSVFARSLIRALTGDETLDVPSPTFTLVQTYDSALGPIWHFDLYRIKDPEEIYELGWDEALNHAVTIIEWPERLGALMPREYIDIHLRSIENEPEQREIDIKRVA